MPISTPLRIRIFAYVTLITFVVSTFMVANQYFAMYESSKQLAAELKRARAAEALIVEGFDLSDVEEAYDQEKFPSFRVVIDVMPQREMSAPEVAVLLGKMKCALAGLSEEASVTPVMVSGILDHDGEVRYKVLKIRGGSE